MKSILWLALALWAATTAACGGDGEGDGTRRSPTLLEQIDIRDRTSFGICVDALGEADQGDNQTAAADTVRTAMAEVIKHDRWADSGYPDLPPIVVAGCPAPPVWEGAPGYDRLLGGDAREVDVPGRFTMFVFF